MARTLHDGFDNREQYANITGDRRLGDISHISDEFLLPVLPQVHAGDFNCLVQPERLRFPSLINPWLIQRVIDAVHEFLHLGENHAGGTMIPRRLSRRSENSLA